MTNVKVMLIQPVSNQLRPVKVAVVLLEYLISIRMAVQHKRTVVFAQKLYIPNRIDED